MPDKHDIEQIESEQIQLKTVSEPLSARYRMSGKLGSGSYGTIYAAVQLSTGKQVAIKVLKTADDDHDAVRFRQEAEALSRLAHPNIVSLVDFGHDEQSRPYLVLDYVDGKTLEAFLKEKGTLDSAQFRDIFTQICKGLAHAHSKGVIHRDLKPSNLMIVEEPNGERIVKVVDFGIARDTARQTRATSTGDFVGTAAYVSPEQAEGHQVDARSDIYSLGCVMYECLTGRLPFEGESAIQSVIKRLHGSALPFKANGLEEIVFRCLERHREGRYPDVTALQADLDKIAEEEKFKAWSRQQRRARVTRKLTSGVAVSSVCLLFAAALTVLAAILLSSAGTGIPIVSVLSLGDKVRQADMELAFADTARKLGNEPLAKQYAESAAILFDGASRIPTNPYNMMVLESRSLDATVRYKLPVRPETIANLDAIAGRYLHDGLRSYAKDTYRMWATYYPSAGGDVSVAIKECADKCAENRNKGKFAEAEQWALKRYYLSESPKWYLDPDNNGRQARAEAANGAAWVYRDRGLLAEAIDMWHIAAESDQPLGPIATGAIWIEIGRCEAEQNKVSKAKDAFDKAMSIFEAEHNQFWTGVVYSQLARLQSEQADRKGAAKLAEQALPLMLNHTDQVEIVKGKNWYGAYFAPIAFVDSCSALAKNGQSKETVDAIEAGITFLESRHATNTYLHTYVGMWYPNDVIVYPQAKDLFDRLAVIQRRIEKNKNKPQ